MRVLFIVTWYSPRNEAVTEGSFHYEQAMALSRYADMALLFPIDKDPHTGMVKQTEEGLLTYRLAQKNSFLPLRFIEMYKDAKKVVEDFKPDIIHAHVAEMAGVVAALLGKKYKIPVVITEHNPIELSHFENPIKRLQVGYAYSHSNANICVSKDSMNRLSKIFPKAAFSVIYNGIINPASCELDDIDYRIKNRINCLIIGSFYSKDIKGYQYLLPAIKRLIDENIPITLHIIGGGEYMEYYINMAKELEISDYCIFYGYCDRQKVYSILSMSDFCVSASIFECSGVSVQESMLLGKPLVVTKSGGANSLVTEDTAIVVDRESIDALCFGIKEMIKRLDEFDAKEITSYAYENFEIDMVSKQYMKLYESLIRS